MPFVPLACSTLADCVAYAHRAGAEIWQRFGVPVYFYEAAALRRLVVAAGEEAASDPAAPVFAAADVGIVGDWRAVVPLLVAALASCTATTFVFHKAAAEPVPGGKS